MERYPGIKEKINEGNWAQAVEELEHCFAKKEWNDELAILAATVAAAEGESELAYDYISRGLQYNYKNYELYFMLGSYYEKRNVNQAWLCCENAEYYCDSAEDREVIRQYRKMLEQSPDWCVKKTSIVILTYNNKELSMQCLDSIRQTTPASSYEIVVVDNASTDGTPEWLREQSDVKCICNTENKGFPEGCNQGIRISEPDHNIFLLNNDTVVLPNSIFWLRMGLYEDDRVGAVGSMTNYASNGQQIEENDVSAGENAERWLKINRPMRHPYEKKSWLVGYALLIRRKALDETGLLDTRFFPGQNEDLDLGLRLNQAGWRTVLCHNSFIIHYGHGGGKNLGLWSSTVADVNKKLTEKWGSDQLYYMWARQEIIDLIDAPRTEPIAVLEIGCGYGATLARIEYLWQHAKVKGIELNETVAGIAGNYLDILPGNVETMQLPYGQEEFDYILFGDVLEHLYDPKKVIKRVLPFLKKGGRLLCSVPNLMNRSVVLPLLQGRFEYEDAGILDRTHIRFFTLQSIRKLMDECGLRIVKISGVSDAAPAGEKEQEMLDALRGIPYLADWQLFQVYQFIFSAQRK